MSTNKQNKMTGIRLKTWECNTLGAFLWDDPDQDQWSKITRIMVHQRNQGIHSAQGFLGSFDTPWPEWSWIIEPSLDHPKGTHPLIHLLWGFYGCTKQFDVRLWKPSHIAVKLTRPPHVLLLLYDDHVILVERKVVILLCSVWIQSHHSEAFTGLLAGWRFWCLSTNQWNLNVTQMKQYRITCNNNY